MKKVLVCVVLALLITTPAIAMRASDFVPAPAMEHAYDVINNLVAQGKVPQFVADIISVKTMKANNTVTGNLTKLISFKGMADYMELKINGSGKKLGAYNTTEFAANNQTVTPLYLQYYPHNIILTFKGYEWWNNTNQKIQNNTGYNYENAFTNASIKETNGTWQMDEPYTAVNPIWESKHVNLTVNTTAGTVDSQDAYAETETMVYNFSINDGAFTSATLYNTSFYVAPNATAAATQDDFNIYIGNDTGKYLIVDGADGLTSTGTQYTGTIDLTPYVSGKTWFNITLEFITDGADDDATQPDVRFDELKIGGAVTKLPTRNPAIDLNGDGVYDYSSTATLTNGTQVNFTLNDTDLKLGTNNLKVYAEGSQKVFVNLSWYDEGRLFVHNVSIAGANVTLDQYLAIGENATLRFFNMTNLKAPVTLTITLDTQHTLNKTFNYSLRIDRFPYMAMSNCIMSVSPADGVSVSWSEPISKPIPLFIKPRSTEATVEVKVYNPQAGVGDTYLNLTVSSVHGNVVDFMLTNITTTDQLDLYIDNNYVKTLNVTNGALYFNLSNFSTHTVTLIPSGALVAPPQEIDWQWVASVIMVITAFIVLVYLLVATIRQR